ncbi:uncharacterized protein LOC141879049 isoform X6 [Acropora palmata]|uniref:uncharacterized protein LOC141879049 isoform X6 n=1 Tax=Acropora palmata TaxID=6131 RepID=UPI003DA12124
MFCSECGKRCEGTDGFCRTCGNHILASCDKASLGAVRSYLNKAQQNRNMYFQAPDSFQDINPGPSTLSASGISGKAENFTALAMRARELKLKKDLGDIQGHGSNFKASQSSGFFSLSGSKRKRGLIEKNESEPLAGISGKAENFTALAMRARELKLKKDLGDIQGHGSNFKASQSSGFFRSQDIWGQLIRGSLEKRESEQLAARTCPSHVVQWIRQVYQKREAVILPVSWCKTNSFQMKDIFTSLRMVAKGETPEKQVTSITSIFTPHERCEQPRIVMIKGEPGMGKTTYCQKLAYDWASKQFREWGESFPRIDVLLLLRCRGIKSTLWDAIEEQILLGKIEAKEKDIFFQFLKENPSKVLLVLDGLEEADPQKLDMFSELIQRKQLPGCYIIFTSRPKAGRKMRLYTDTRLKIVGFATTDAECYIRKYYQHSEDMAEELISKVKFERELRELTRNPLNTLLLCVIFEKGQGILPNRTQLYLEIVLLILRRFESKNGLSNTDQDLLLVYKKELMILGEAALDALRNQRPIFCDYEGDIKERSLIKIVFLSSLTVVRWQAPRDFYVFLHKAFQEFFAGYFLAVSCIDDVTNYRAVPIDERCMGEVFHVFEFMRGLLALRSEETALSSEQGSSVPAEIRARGPRAERAFQKALQTGKVKVYRGRIMLLGQDRAGKTSLKKSLLGLPFDPNQESTVGVEVDRSRCEIEVDEVVNWMPSERKKHEVSEFEVEIARFIARDLTESEADDDSTAIHPNVEELKTTDKLEEAHEEPTLLPDVNETATDAEETREIAEDGKKAVFEEKLVDKDEVSDVRHLDISSTTLRNNVTAQVMHHLQSPRLEDDIKSKEAILTLWDFAGQHLYYASHPVFLSGRAVYILVHNLNKSLLATAEPLVRQGMNDILLENPNNETNLDNLLSWLVSVHNIRSNANTNVAHHGTKQSYLRPPVIIVGTNLDQPFEDVKTAENHIKNSVLGKDYAKHVIMPFFTVNNKAENDEGVQKLRHKIMEVLKDEPYMPEEVPLRWFNFERAVDALVAKQIYFMDLNQLLSIIRQVCHIDDEEEVTAMLNFYHDLGVIVKHGRTVVLQAQWLIDLFKQLITVRPHDEADPLYVNCWRELERNGILRMALVDHVFSEFSKKGLRKQDILDMMELYGLIAKFSNATDENQDEQSYFVPTQLRSSPSALCEIKPSECDPCPLVLHFRDGFVPHGLFPRLVSEFIHWCSENGFRNTPQLFNNGARLFIGKQIIFDLILICKKRFIKIVLKRRNASSSKPLLMSDSNEMAFEVRNFIERTLDGFSRDLCWLSNLQYELSVVCTHCLQSRCSLHRLMSCSQDDCLHLLRVRSGEELICEKNFCDETVSPGWEMWFEVPDTQTKEPNKDTSEAVGLDESVSFKLGTLSKDDVLLIAHELGPSWKKVALALNVSYAEINEIEADETKVFERCHAVLTCWQERYVNDATYHRLALALQHPAVGRVDLAVKFCGLQSGKDVPVAN